MSIAFQYYGYNSVFNSSRAVYISTYSLFLAEVLNLPLAWLPWVLVGNLFVTMLFEIPTGVYADLHGRKKSFLLAASITGIGYLVYATTALAHPTPVFALIAALLAELALAIGYTFYSGSLDAWLVDSLNQQDSRILQKVFSYGQTWKNVLYVAGGVIGILIYFLDDVATTTFGAAALISFFLFLDARKRMTPDKPPGSSNTLTNPTANPKPWRSFHEQFRNGLSIVRGDVRIARVIAAAAISFFFLQLIVFSWPYYLLHEVDNPIDGDGRGWIGGALAGTWVLAYFARAGGNLISARDAMSSSPFRSISIALAINSIPIIVLAGIPLLRNEHSATAYLIALSMAGYALMRFGEGIGDPLRQMFLNRLLEPSHRATILSLNSSVAMLVSGVGLAAAGVLLSAGVSLQVVWIFAGALQLSSLGLYASVFPPRSSQW